MYTSLRHNTRPGIAALMVVVLIGSTLLILGLASNARGLNTLELSVLQSRIQQSHLQMESCVEEALLWLYKDPHWSGDTLSVGETSCTITVFDTPTGKEITITAVDQRPVSLVVSLRDGAWRITKWNE